MTNYSTLKHKRSQARGLISIPFPTSSSTFMLDTNNQQQEDVRPRFSGESLTPNDGYSGLFTSGMFPNCVPTPSPTLSSFPSPPKSNLTNMSDNDRYQSPQKGQNQNLAPPSSYTYSYSNNNNLSTPNRRRRSSIIHTTPSSVSPKKIKSVGVDGGVERALDNVMRNLKISITPKKYSYSSNKLQSRWSSSTEGSSCENEGTNEGESGFFVKPRKSSETSRSRITIKSKKSRKSEDTDRTRMDMDLPPQTGAGWGQPQDVPEVPPIPVQPVTPGRSRRMMNGLVKRLGLTPKKSKQSMTPAMALAMNETPLPLALPARPTTGNSAFNQPPPADLPLPPFPFMEERSIPRKSSLSTLRSALTKKSSNTTLRSFKSGAPSTSASHPHHPFAHLPGVKCDSPPPPIPNGLPLKPRYPSQYHNDDDEDGIPECFPTTPKSSGRRTPKSSIGPPKLKSEELSPSHFLIQLPRKAPCTPKRETLDIDSDTRAEMMNDQKQGQEEGVIRFEEEDLGDIVMEPTFPTSPLLADGEHDQDGVPDLDSSHNDDSLRSEEDKSQEIFTPLSKPSQAQIVIQQTLNSLTRNELGSPFQPNQFSTPTSIHSELDGKSRRPMGLTIDSLKNKKKVFNFPLGSPVSIGNTPEPPSLRSIKTKKSLEVNKRGYVEPLSMKNVNSMGLPIPSSTPSVAGKSSRKDPLGIIRKFRQSSKPPNDEDTENDHMMPYRNGGGDGWSTPMPMPIAFPEPRPSGDSSRKLNLGTVESYFDPNLGTFRTPKTNTNTGYNDSRGIFDFSSSPPPSRAPSSSSPQMQNEGYNLFDQGVTNQEQQNSRFQDQDHDQDYEMNLINQSPEYFFQLEQPTQIDFDIDDYNDDEEDNSNEHERMGGEEGDAKWVLNKKTSGHTIHTMTTGEGVEEWELERYLRDLDN